MSISSLRWKHGSRRAAFQLMDMEKTIHTYFCGLGYVDASFTHFAYLVRGFTSSAHFAAMSSGLIPSSTSVTTGPTAVSTTTSAAATVGPRSPVLDVEIPWNTLSAIAQPILSQAESLASRFILTGAHTQSSSSGVVDGPQPSTLRFPGGSAPGQVSASFNSSLTIPSSVPVTTPSGGPPMTTTYNLTQSPAPSQINASLSQGGHTTSVGLIVGLVLFGVFLAALMVYFALCRMRRRRVQKPLTYSVLPGEKVTFPLSPMADGVEKKTRSFPSQRASSDFGHSWDPSVSTYPELPYTQRAHTDKSMYSNDSS
ncbi:hypothetical protein EDC04DRAFT_158209 [Pisolithus marmoratus]|nr:hypothetical protein EDC04DRAFT_158209 [Pisolithus marmoratus]